MNKTLVFDMDGTIANLYGVEGWLDDLRAENPRPYIEAEPLYNMDILNYMVNLLRSLGWRVVVTTWLAKGASAEYNKATREAKLAWLEKYKFPYDEIHLVKYGTTKADCTRKNGGYQILIDDNEKVRLGWSLGNTIDASKNIMQALLKIIEETIIEGE